MRKLLCLLALLSAGCGQVSTQVNPAPPTTGTPQPPTTTNPLPTPSPPPAPSPLPSAVVGTATVDWVPPSTNTDGSVLSDLTGYHILYGTVSGQYTQDINVSNPGLTTYVIQDLAAGTYYIVMTAYNSGGISSAWSSPEVSKTIQ